MTVKNKADVINSASSNLHTHHVLQSGILLCKKLKGTYYAYFHLHVFHSWAHSSEWGSFIWCRTLLEPLSSSTVVASSACGPLFLWLAVLSRQKVWSAGGWGFCAAEMTTLGPSALTDIIHRQEYKHLSETKCLEQSEAFGSQELLAQPLTSLFEKQREVQVCFLITRHNKHTVLRHQRHSLFSLRHCSNTTERVSRAWLITTRPSPDKLAWVEML